LNKHYQKKSSSKAPRGRKRTIEVIKEKAPQTQIEISKEDLPIVKIF